MAADLDLPALQRVVDGARRMLTEFDTFFAAVADKKHDDIVGRLIALGVRFDGHFYAREALRDFDAESGPATVGALLGEVARLQQRSLTCCFCHDQCKTLVELQQHSADCQKHPMLKELRRLRRVEEAAKAYSDVTLIPSAGDPTIASPSCAEHAALIAALTTAEE